MTNPGKQRDRERYNNDPEYRRIKLLRNEKRRQEARAREKALCDKDPKFKKSWLKKNKKINERKAAAARERYQDEETKKKIKDKNYNHRIKNRNSDAVLARRKYQLVKRRALAFGLPFNLTPEYLRNLLVAQNRKCAITGRELNHNSTLSNDSPSIDRVKSALGYVEGNVRWVTHQVNCAIGVGSVEEFLDMCRDAIRHSKKR